MRGPPRLGFAAGKLQQARQANGRARIRMSGERDRFDELRVLVCESGIRSVGQCLSGGYRLPLSAEEMAGVGKVNRRDGRIVDFARPPDCE